MAYPNVLDDTITEMQPSNHNPEKPHQLETRFSGIDRIRSHLMDRNVKVLEVVIPDVHSRIDEADFNLFFPDGYPVREGEIVL